LRIMIQDGCPVNGAAVTALVPLLPDVLPPICVSHGSNVIGKILPTTCPAAKKFEELWSYMMTTSLLARSIFKNLLPAGEKLQRSNEIRWYQWWEICKQIDLHFDDCVSVINHTDEFAEATRLSLREFLVPGVIETMRAQSSLISDIGLELVKLCYKQEGDGFECVTTYDHWYSVLSFLRAVANPDSQLALRAALLPTLHATVSSIVFGHVPVDVTNPAYVTLMEDTIATMLPVYEKMLYDTNNRMEFTINLHRTCRLFNWEFVCGTNILALENEFVQINRIPMAL
jgi:hypothetical protein